MTSQSPLPAHTPSAQVPSPHGGSAPAHRDPATAPAPGRPDTAQAPSAAATASPPAPSPAHPSERSGRSAVAAAGFRSDAAPAAPDVVVSAGPAASFQLDGGDPVKVLLLRHRALCARAVDPLELAAGLEAAGITDRMAARFKHRNVFALAEEMYARAARGSAKEPVCVPVPGTAGVPRVRGLSASVAWLHETWARTGWWAVALLPGAACGLALLGLRLTGGWMRVAVAAVGVLATAAGLCAALRHGPLRTEHRAGPVTRVWTCVLIGYALVGDGLLRGAVAGGGWGVLGTARRTFAAFRAPVVPWSPFAAHGGSGASAPWHAAFWWAMASDAVRGIGSALSWEPSAVPAPDVFRPLAAASVLALALAVVPAACCARLFATCAARKVGRSRALAEFTASAWPLPAAVCALFLWALGVLLTFTAAVLHQKAEYAGAGALGILLMLARLLAVQGFTRAPAVLIGAAGATEVLALAVVCTAGLPACAGLAARIESAVGTLGPGIVPAAACGACALVLLAYAARSLSRASAHLPQPAARGATVRGTTLPGAASQGTLLGTASQGTP